MKVSELTINDVADYLRIEPEDLDDEERRSLKIFLDAAIHHAETHTGLNLDDMDNHPDISIAVCCLAGDFYTNRDMISSAKGENKTVKSILDMYAVNLL